VVLARGRIPAPILLCGEAPGVSEDVLGSPFIGPAGKLLDHILARAIDGQFDYCLTNLVGCIPRVPPPVVVNMRKSEYDVRIDRQSEWGNPFVIGKDGTRSEVIDKYADWLPMQLKLVGKLQSLAGKRLGCYCYPQPCHGDVIVKLFSEVIGNDKVSEPPEESIKTCSERLAEFISICKPKLIVMVGKLADKWVPRVTEQIERRRGEKAVQWASITHPAAILRMDVSQRGLAIQRCIVTLEDAVAEL
jgi:uracil-DNA glycosylase